MGDKPVKTTELYVIIHIICVDNLYLEIKVSFIARYAFW